MQPCNESKEFIISNYLHLLGDKQPNGKYICPNCGKANLSINAKGEAYTCYSCYESKRIAYLLREKNGEFNSRNKVSKLKVVSQDNDKKLKLIELIELVETEYKGLRYNTQSLQPWLNDKPFNELICDLETFHIYLAKKHHKDFPKDKVIDTVIHYAKKYPFNPLEEYLKGLAKDFRSSFKNLDDFFTGTGSILSALSATYLNTDNSLYDEYLKNCILSAVGRVINPGCYVRYATILQGEQDIGKTSFWNALGGNFFTSSLGDAKGKDELLLLRLYWILEWGEIEGLWGRKALADVKNFITRRHDAFRPPYGKNVEQLPRSCIIVGSSNLTDFLTDRTGNSRFPVIPCGSKEIKVSKFEGAREEILGAAAAIILMYLEIDPKGVWKGDYWKLSPEYRELDRQNSGKFLEPHEWEETILNEIDTWGGSGFILPEKIWDALDISQKERPRYRNQVSSIMNLFGWVYGQKKIQGKNKRVWLPKTD